MLVYFGQNDNGDGYGNRTADVLRGCKFTNNAGTGTLTELGINLQAPVVGHIRLGVYEHVSSDEPYDLLLDAGVLTNPGAGWNTISGLSLPVTYGTTYWLAWTTDATVSVYANSAAIYYWRVLAYGALPDPFLADSSGGTRQSIRAGVEVPESGSGSGVFTVDDIINGPIHWGRRAVFDSLATGGGGVELYDEADACEIGAGEVNGVGTWAVGPSGGSLASVGSTESNWAIRFTRDQPGMMEQGMEDSNVCAVVAGTKYYISLKGKISAGTNYATLIVSDGSGVLGYVNIGYDDSGDWTDYAVIVMAGATGALSLRLRTQGKYAIATDAVDLDEISVRAYDPDTWADYQLPDSCNGPWLVTLDGVPLGQGDQEDDLGWHYNESTHVLHLSEGMTVPNGVANLWVYYYTDQVPENVQADILVWAGYYATRAAALADMDYTATGVIIPRVWFDVSSGPNSAVSSFAAIQAVTKLCERVNYRFWFDYDGRPCFLPAPVADAIDFAFPEPGDLRSLSEYQDEGMVRNRIVIEGSQRVMFQVSKDDKASDRYKGEDSDPASILVYLEKTYSINNHLFQDQVSLDAMCVTLLSEGKDPKWYADLTLFANPIPLELGDVVEWPAELEPTPAADVDSGNLVVSMMGIIRDIKINNAEANYKVEIVDYLGSGSSGDEPSGEEIIPDIGAFEYQP